MGHYRSNVRDLEFNLFGVCVAKRISNRLTRNPVEMVPNHRMQTPRCALLQDAIASLDFALLKALHFAPELTIDRRQRLA